jgi:hypothetical protein
MHRVLPQRREFCEHTNRRTRHSSATEVLKNLDQRVEFESDCSKLHSIFGSKFINDSRCRLLHHISEAPTITGK